jgi:hypothetical protein
VVRRLSVLIALALLLAMAASQPAQARSCGDTRSGGGPYDIRAKHVGCRLARRVARHCHASSCGVGGIQWHCHTRSTGRESSASRCTAGSRRVRWTNGA